MKHETKYIKFVGDDDRFVLNVNYSYVAISERTKIPLNTVKNRLSRKKEFSEQDLIARRKPARRAPIFETPEEAFSAKWLKRRLI